MKIKSPRRAGFTLTELLMVVVILGVLSSIALPRFAPQREKAFVAEAIGILSAIRQAEEAFRLENGIYLDPASNADWENLGIENPNTGNLNWAFDLTVTAGPPPTFIATARRLAGNRANNCVEINQAGTYSAAPAGNGCTGLHPNSPR